MKRVTFLAIAMTLVASLGSYAVEKVEVTNLTDNKGGIYAVGELTEGDKFFHDRNYTITNIPKEFLELTRILTSADSPGGQDYRLTFDIDRPAFLYTAWDSRNTRPEERGQDPEAWFTESFEDTGKTLFLDAPHPRTEYFVYQSVEPYLKGKVEILGIDGDPVIMWTLFLEAGTLAVEPGDKLTTTWGQIKAQR